MIFLKLQQYSSIKNLLKYILGTVPERHRRVDGGLFSDLIIKEIANLMTNEFINEITIIFRGDGEIL